MKAEGLTLVVRPVSRGLNRIALHFLYDRQLFAVIPEVKMMLPTIPSYDRKCFPYQTLSVVPIGPTLLSEEFHLQNGTKLTIRSRRKDAKAG